MKLERGAAVALLASIGLTTQAASFGLSFGPYSAEADKFSDAPPTDTYDFNFAGVSGIASASLIGYRLSKHIDTDRADSLVLTVYGGWGGPGAVGNGASAFQPGLRGSYDLSVAAQPVPESQTYALMLAGLGIVLFVAFRRRQAD